MMQLKSRSSLVLLLVFAAFVPGAAAQSSSGIQAKFAASIANRMGMQAVACPSGDASLFGGSTRFEIFCFQHNFASFSSFEPVWNSAAEWEGVFLPDPAYVTQMKSYGMGASLMGHWFNEISQGDFREFATQYQMRAGKWGFDGWVGVDVGFGFDKGYLNLLKMLFIRPKDGEPGP